MANKAISIRAPTSLFEITQQIRGEFEKDYGIILSNIACMNIMAHKMKKEKIILVQRQKNKRIERFEFI